jgi:hypothetical protein
MVPARHLREVVIKTSGTPGYTEQNSEGGSDDGKTLPAACKAW